MSDIISKIFTFIKSDLLEEAVKDKIIKDFSITRTGNYININITKNGNTSTGNSKKTVQGIKGI